MMLRLLIPFFLILFFTTNLFSQTYPISLLSTDSLRQLVALEADPKQKMELYYKLGRKTGFSNHYDEAFLVYKEAIAYSDSMNLGTNDPNYYGICIGIAFIYGETNLDTSIIMLKDLQLRANRQQIDLSGEFDRALGVSYALSVQYNLAAEHFDKGLLKARNKGDALMEGRILNQKAHLYRMIGEDEKALEMFRTAAEIQKGLNDNLFFAHTLGGIATCYLLNSNNLDSAAYYYKEAFNLALPYPDLNYLRYCYSDMAYIYMQKGHYKLSLNYLEKALDMARADGKMFNIIYVLSNLIEVSQKAKLWKQATFYAKELEQLASTTQGMEAKHRAYRILSAYAEAYEPKKALGYFKIYKSTSDSLIAKKQEAAQEVQLKYEKEKQAKELVQKDIELLQIQKEKQKLLLYAVSFIGVFLGGVFIRFYQIKLTNLKKLEALKGKIAANLHDGTGSIINGISRIAELIQQNELSPTEQEKEIQRIRRLSVDAQSTMSDIIWSLNESEASMKQLLERIQDFADDVLLPLKIPFKIQVSPEIAVQEKLSGDYRHQLLMVFKEAINNAVKHTEPEKINLTVANVQSEYHILITNWFEERRDAKFSSGYGLSNISNRIQSLNGQVDFQEKEESFVINIFLPILN